MVLGVYGITYLVQPPFSHTIQLQKQLLLKISYRSPLIVPGVYLESEEICLN